MRKPTSQRKVESNRRNALKSTGPKTPEGKQIVRWNPLKHGLLAREVIIPVGDAQESSAEFDALLQALHNDLQPVGVVEEMLVEKIAVCYWRLRRVLRCEVGEIRKNTDNLEFRTALNRAEDVRLAKGLAYRSPVMCRLMESTDGIDRLLHILDSLREDLEENGHFSELAVDELREVFGSERETFGCSALFFHWAATQSDDEDVDAELPDPETCKAALLSLIDNEKKRYETMRGAIAEQEEMSQTAILASLSLPQADVTERILRYETAIEKQLYRALEQLDRLRRQRRGEPPPPTVNVDL